MEQSKNNPQIVDDSEKSNENSPTTRLHQGKSNNNRKFDNFHRNQRGNYNNNKRNYNNKQRFQNEPKPKTVAELFSNPPQDVPLEEKKTEKLKNEIFKETSSIMSSWADSPDDDESFLNTPTKWKNLDTSQESPASAVPASGATSEKEDSSQNTKPKSSGISWADQDDDDDQVLQPTAKPQDLPKVETSVKSESMVPKQSNLQENDLAEKSDLVKDESGKNLSEKKNRLKRR